MVKYFSNYINYNCYGKFCICSFGSGSRFAVSVVGSEYKMGCDSIDSNNNAGKQYKKENKNKSNLLYIE